MLTLYRGRIRVWNNRERKTSVKKKKKKKKTLLGKKRQTRTCKIMNKERHEYSGYSNYNEYFKFK